MTSKERFKNAITFKPVDRLPFNFWMDRRLLKEYEDSLGEEFRVNHYGADVIETFALLPWPAGPSVFRDGSYWFVEPPLLEDMEKAHELELPDPEDPAVYTLINETLEKNPDAAVIINIPGPLSLLHGIRLVDNIYYDMYDYPDELLALIKRIMDIQTRVIEKVVDLPISGIYFQDDIAASGGLMFSVDMCKTFILDHMKEGIAIAKKANLPVLYHSDGGVMDILDTLVEMGIDAVNPLQPDFNDYELFAEKYAGKLAVYGGIDNTKIIPYGSKAEIKEHIEYIYDKLGKNSGLIMSSHDIPYECPKENIDYMVELIKTIK